MLKHVQEAEPIEQTPYEALRSGLIWGRWKSGERLMPPHLKKELGCTGSALREALIRLSGEGFVEANTNFGFRACVQSESVFRQAAHLRLILECEAATLSVQNGDFDWEMLLNASHNKLNYIENQMLKADDIGPYIQRWSLQDWEFHHALLSACGSELLMRAYQDSYDKFRMYAVSEISNFGFSGKITIGEHKDIYDAAISKDVPATIRALKNHLVLYQDENRSNQPMPTKKIISTKQQL
jgi:DNA-binding GntR family transcriptional regulator